jgi:hypothetical protein
MSLANVANSLAFLAGGFICGVAAATLAFAYVWNAKVEGMRIKMGRRHE